LTGCPNHYQGLLKQGWGAPNGFHLGFRVTEEGMDRQLIGEFDGIHQRLRTEGGGILSVSSHEVEWITRGFWDENFRQGKLVLPQDLRPAALDRDDSPGGAADRRGPPAHAGRRRRLPGLPRARPRRGLARERSDLDADFLATISRALVTLHRTGELPNRLEIARGNVSCTRYAPAEASVSTWPAFPPDFADHNGVAFARLQCWTLKPTVRG